MAVTIFDSNQASMMQSHLVFGKLSVRESKGVFNSAQKQEKAGFQVSPPAQDPFAVVIKERTRYKVKSLMDSVVTAQDGLIQIKIADTGLRTVRKVLLEMKTIVAEAAKDETPDVEREVLNQRLAIIVPTELDKTINRTTYNKKKLMDGTFATEFVFSRSNNLRVPVKIGDMRSAALNLNALDISSKSGADSAQVNVNNALRKLDLSHANVQKADRRITSILANDSRLSDDLLQHTSNIRSKSTAAKYMELMKTQLLNGNPTVISPKDLHQTNNQTVLELISNTLHL